MLRPAELVIDECDVEAELAEVLRPELPGLELDHHVPELLDVEEQQVDVEVVPVDVEVHLPADEREPLPELAEGVVFLLVRINPPDDVAAVFEVPSSPMQQLTGEPGDAGHESKV
ncbi:hypothetical protein QF011_003578 [Curtobacterium flaccumfaciens]|nr:hypothetical protein [Curtobacterium flaccumfaciens]